MVMGWPVGGNKDQEWVFFEIILVCILCVCGLSHTDTIRKPVGFLIGS